MICSAILVASGSSRRMGFDKLTAPLAGIPVLRRAVDALAAAPSVVEIIIVTPADRFEALGLGAVTGKPVVRVDGGEQRRDSVARGLAAVHEDATHIVVHDGARPLVTVEAIEQCIAAAHEFGAAALARRLHETVMRAGSDNFTRVAVDRSGLWVMETPQVFRSRILRRAYQLVRERAEPVTDEVSAVSLLGVSTYLVESATPNPKITLPGDIRDAERMMA